MSMFCYTRRISEKTIKLKQNYCDLKEYEKTVLKRK